MDLLEKKIKSIIKFLIIFCIFWFSSYLQYIPVYLLHLDVGNLSNAMHVVLSTFSSTIVLFILFFVYRKDLGKDFKKFRKNYLDDMDVGLRYWGIGLFIMFVSNFILTFIFKAGGANNEEAVQEMIKALPLLMILDAGIIAPINEELVFRKSLKDIFNNKWLFALPSFLLFGLAHVIGSAKSVLDYLYLIPYGALGGAFALAYYDTDTIFTSISLHMIHNLILVILSVVMALM